VLRHPASVELRNASDYRADIFLQDGTSRRTDAYGDASTRAAKLSRTQYEGGQVAYIDVLDTERTLLQARREAIQLHGTQAVSTVQLIRALGGGWNLETVAPLIGSAPTHGGGDVTNASLGKAPPIAADQ